MSIRKIGNSWFADFYINGKKTRKKLSTNKATAQRIYKNLDTLNQFAAFGINPDGYPLL